MLEPFASGGGAAIKRREPARGMAEHLVTPTLPRGNGSTPIAAVSLPR
jgi:hypothetical protein